MRGCIDVVFERNDCCHFSTKVFNGKGKVTSAAGAPGSMLLKRSEEHTSELQSQSNLVCRLLLEKKDMYGILVLSHTAIGPFRTYRDAFGQAGRMRYTGSVVALNHPSMHNVAVIAPNAPLMADGA